MRVLTTGPARAASGHSRGGGNPSSRRQSALVIRHASLAIQYSLDIVRRTSHVVCVLFVVLCLTSRVSSALALPSGGHVAGGAATIEQSASKTTITQQSDRALLNWQGFSIGSKETV